MATLLEKPRLPTEPADIDYWIKKLNLPMARVGLEAGSLLPWLCHELLALGYHAICIETRHAKAATCEEPRQPETSHPAQESTLSASETDRHVPALMTIPGVGPLTALAYKTYVGRPQRKNPKEHSTLRFAALLPQLSLRLIGLMPNLAGAHPVV